jgi:uncharacterized protein YjbI with pentapeptide repeats
MQRERCDVDREISQQKDQRKLRPLLITSGAFLLFIIFIIYIRVFPDNWTGFLNWAGFSTKTLWDWMQLLIIPGVLLGAGAILNQIQKKREERITQGQKEVEQEVATDNQRESLLQSYLDKMSELLVDKQLLKSEPEEEIREIARVRTLTVLSRLDSPRIRGVLQFLHEASLIDKNKHIIDLHGANLSGAKLSGVNLCDADLRGVDLSGATLFVADLSESNLSESNLFTADLSGAKLSGVNLCDADLRGAYLGSVDLSKATLDGATLSKEDLHNANLNGAALRGANLRGAILYGADLREATLCGADLSGANLSKAYLGSFDLSGATLDGAYLDDARVTSELEDSANEGITLKLPELPNPDKKYARFHQPGRVRGPLRTFGGPLSLPCNVQYDLEENTVKYIELARFMLVVRLIIPTLISLGLIISLLYLTSLEPNFYLTSLELYISIAILVMFFVFTYIIINYVDDVYILTTKRIIHIKPKSIFLFEEHDSITYDKICDIKVEIRYPFRDLIRGLHLRYPSLLLDLDIGTVFVRSPDQPDIIIPLADHPFDLQDLIFLIKKHMEKNDGRK